MLESGWTPGGLAGREHLGLVTRLVLVLQHVIGGAPGGGTGRTDGLPVLAWRHLVFWGQEMCLGLTIRPGGRRVGRRGECCEKVRGWGKAEGPGVYPSEPSLSKLYCVNVVNGAHVVENSARDSLML